MINELADVRSIQIGENTNIWQFAIVLENAVIGKNCNINCHTFIENDVTLGDNVTLKSGVYLWDGIRIDDNVFIGPNVTFTNDKYPRSKNYPATFQNTIIGKGATIGAGAIILGGINIGDFAFIGAGAVVTKDVPSRALVIGNPAKRIGWVNNDGTKMVKVGEKDFLDSFENLWVENNNMLKLA